MKNPKRYSLPFKRRLNGRTNYKKRLKLIASGQYRLIVRKSLRNITASLAKYSSKGDLIEVTVNSSTLQKYGWKTDRGNIPSAYLVGCLLAKKADEKGITEAVLDLGLNSSVKGSRIYAVVAGAVENGLSIPHDESILPSKDRIDGSHIAKYAELLKKDKQSFEKQFSLYTKNNFDPAKIQKHFEEIKNKILKL